MATSSCPKCEHHHFEVKTVEPRGSNYKENFVQCTNCGTVVGIVEYYNVGSLVKDLEERIEKVERNVMGALQTINRNLALLERAIKHR